MIADRALTPKEQDIAQRVFVRYSGMSALAANCCSMTTLVLLALYLGISDVTVSCMGAFNYLKYMILPLGFCFAGRWGVAKSLRNYATGNSAVALLIVLAALTPLFHMRQAGVGLFFAGVFLLYSLQACSSSTAFALQKNITSPQTLPRLASRLQQIGAAAGLFANLAIAGLFAVTGNAAALPLLFFAAAVLYFFGSRIIPRMPEPSVLRKLSAQPMLPQIRTAWQDPLIRRTLWIGVVQNLVFVTITPMNLLTVKLGCGTGNAQVLILTSIQLVAMLFIALCYKTCCTRFGPRKVMICTCPVVWLMAAYWILIPVERSFAFLIIPFMLNSVLDAGFATAMGNYISMIVPNKLQLGGSILIFLFHGGLVGILGIFINPALLRIISGFAGPDPMSPYRWYYLIVGLISIPGIFAFIALPKEKKGI